MGEASLSDSDEATMHMKLKTTEAEDLMLSPGEQSENKKQGTTGMSLSPTAGSVVSTRVTPTETFDFFAYRAQKEIEEQSNSKKQRTTEISLPPSAGSEVPTELAPFDETWPTENRKPHVKEWSEAEIKEKPVARKIAAMKKYRPGEKEEEKRKGVSTKLELYLDPWIIKKKLKRSDLDHLSRLLLPINLVEKHVLPLMDVDIVKEIPTKDGLLVTVCDQDTDSAHHLTFKRYPSSKCYVLNGSWNREFVKRRNLKMEDEIGMYWDPISSRFNFRVLKRAPTIQPPAAAAAANGASSSGRN